MQIHIPPRGTQPISADERKQLADLFIALMELDQKQKVNKGKTYAISNQQYPDHTC